jgi:hypothetical protein
VSGQVNASQRQEYARHQDRAILYCNEENQSGISRSADSARHLIVQLTPSNSASVNILPPEPARCVLSAKSIRTQNIFYYQWACVLKIGVSPPFSPSMRDRSFRMNLFAHWSSKSYQKSLRIIGLRILTELRNDYYRH